MACDQTLISGCGFPIEAIALLHISQQQANGQRFGLALGGFGGRLQLLHHLLLAAELELQAGVVLKR